MIGRGSVLPLAAAVLAMALPVAHAADYKSIGSAPAVLYDAPTTRGRKLSVAPRGMPVEVVVSQGDWARVRDASGELSWVEKKMLVDQRTVVANGTISIHASADDAAPVTFRASPGVVLNVLDPPANGWVHVKHRDGDSGWAKVGDLWGIS